MKFRSLVRKTNCCHFVRMLHIFSLAKWNEVETFVSMDKVVLYRCIITLDSVYLSIKSLSMKIEYRFWNSMQVKASVNNHQTSFKCLIKTTT